MSKITIRNLRGHDALPPGFYVGRTNLRLGLAASYLSNPFRLERDTAEERAEVYAQYTRWLWGKLKAGDLDVTWELDHLVKAGQRGDVVLWCWCAPQQCHARAVALAIRYLQRLRNLPVSEIVVAGLAVPAKTQLDLFAEVDRCQHKE